ncbi:hypothetical protein DRW07_14920 [Alteromonas sediminis]|uniref:Uncharacterized protein n=1 Tax=Alteromonas sediminis TaxID=2259342 RepID=A0A3N5Z9S4_9ALTE|nr:hypothetical protein [Alteromonas sediminis]RPJ66088.1 hypothetical protein DRW07_14920 [Alteromonas sediminis]
MSSQKNSEQIKALKASLIKTQLIEAPGAIMVGLGLYGKFGANGDAFLPLLNDPSTVNFMLAVGAIIMAWGAFKTIKISSQINKLS